MSDAILDVLNPYAVLYAVASGFAFGATVITWVTLRYGTSPPLRGRMSFMLTVVIIGVIGIIFYASQVAQAVVQSDDDETARIIGRLVVWITYSVALGVGYVTSMHFAQERRRGRDGSSRPGSASVG